MSKILLIEDEENIRRILSYDLKKAGYEITECGDGKEALMLAQQYAYDVLIIDWMLPEVSGIEIVKKLRSKGVDSIMMMLTARDDESDILYAFEEGVDDYMTKPFSPRELAARVHAHLKRQKKEENTGLCFCDLTIDLKKHTAYIQDNEMVLTKKEFDLLEYFVKNKDIVLSRDNILNEIWGFDYDGDTRIVDVHVFKLRNKLTDSLIHIRSLRGVGYIMEKKKDD